MFSMQSSYKQDKSSSLDTQRLQNKVLRTTGNFPGRTPVRELHKAFNIPNICDYFTKLCRQQAEAIQIQSEGQYRKHKRLKLGGGQVYDRSSIWAAVVA
jgi:hypothetical protein